MIGLVDGDAPAHRARARGTQHGAVAPPTENVIHHSDQGTQYTSIAFGQRCKDAGVRPSMGSVGDCYDNAMCESFFATLECELLDRSSFRTQSEARLQVFDFIEGFYNTHRRHSALGYVSPIEYEECAEPLEEPRALRVSVGPWVMNRSQTPKRRRRARPPVHYEPLGSQVLNRPRNRGSSRGAAFRGRERSLARRVLGRRACRCGVRSVFRAWVSLRSGAPPECRCPATRPAHVGALVPRCRGCSLCSSHSLHALSRVATHSVAILSLGFCIHLFAMCVKSWAAYLTIRSS